MKSILHFCLSFDKCCLCLCSGTEKQNLFAFVRENKYLIFYFEIKLERGGVVCCTRIERNKLAGFNSGIWKLSGQRIEFVKGRCLLCREEEDASHVLFKCSELRKRSKNFPRNQGWGSSYKKGLV